MAMKNRAHREPTIDYQSGVPRAEDFSRGGLVSHYLCRLTGQITLSGANNTAAKLKRGGALAVMRKLRVRLNSQENAVELDPTSILIDNWFLLNRWPRDITATLGDGGTANPAFDITFVIPFTLPRRKVALPADTSLDLRGNVVSKVEIEVEWGSHTDINGDATGFTVAPKLETVSMKHYDAPDAFTPGFIRRWLISHSLTSTNPRELIRLPATLTYFGFVLGAVVDGSDSITTYNRIRLVSGSTVFEDHLPQALVDGSRLWHDRAETNFEKSSAFNQRAYHPIELPYDGNLREMLVTQDLADFNLELDVTKSGTTHTLTALAYQYVPPIQRAA